MNKKAMVMAAALVATLGVFAAPHGGPRGGHGGPRGGRPGPVVRHHGGGHHGGAWGHGGRNFWPGFVGGVVGGVLYDAVTPAPRVVAPPPPVVVTPVVSTPVATVQNVWVEGRYVDQVQPNGTIIRVWQPGHYEQRTVYVP